MTSHISLYYSSKTEHIATRLRCPWFSVERINSYELILHNEHKNNRCLLQKFLPHKINSSQKIKVCRFQWTPGFRIIWTNVRSRRRRCSVKKMFLKIRKFHRKITVLGSFFDKVAGLRSETLLKRDSNTPVFL